METPIVIESCDVDFVTSKKNDYNETIYYFKLVDRKLQKKLKPFINASKLDNGTKLPYWCADNGEYLMKVKSKYVGECEQELIKGRNYNAKIEFVYYNMVEKDIKGYFAKIGEFKSKGYSTKNSKFECSRQDKPVMSDDSRD